jgi:hypothetical protein
MTSASRWRIAKAGYAVIAPGLPDHGENRIALTPAAAVPGGVDVDAALLCARGRASMMAIALVGHSMGAYAVLGHAQSDPGIGAVVAISGGRELTGPFAPPNAFFIWASGDPDGTRKRGRELAAKVAGKEQIVEDKTYGEIERGSGVRMSEVPGTDHITILYSAEAARRIVDWIATALGPGNGTPETPGPDPRFLWSGLGMLAVLVLAFGAPRALAQIAPRIGLPRVGVRSCRPWSPSRSRARCSCSRAPMARRLRPFSFVPRRGSDLFGFFALAGGLLLAFGARGRSTCGRSRRCGHLALRGAAVRPGLPGARHAHRPVLGHLPRTASPGLVRRGDAAHAAVLRRDRVAAARLVARDCGSRCGQGLTPLSLSPAARRPAPFVILLGIIDPLLRVLRVVTLQLGRWVPIRGWRFSAAFTARRSPASSRTRLGAGPGPRRAPSAAARGGAASAAARAQRAQASVVNQSEISTSLRTSRRSGPDRRGSSRTAAAM